MEKTNSSDKKKDKLAKEHVKELMNVAEMLTSHINQFEIKIAQRTERLEIHTKELEKRITKLKNK